MSMSVTLVNRLCYSAEEHTIKDNNIVEVCLKYKCLK